MMTLRLDSVSIFLKFCEFAHRFVHPEFDLTFVLTGASAPGRRLRRRPL